jgi:hypothetical protein
MYLLGNHAKDVTGVPAMLLTRPNGTPSALRSAIPPSACPRASWPPSHDQPRHNMCAAGTCTVTQSYACPAVCQCAKHCIHEYLTAIGLPPCSALHKQPCVWATPQRPHVAHRVLEDGLCIAGPQRQLASRDTGQPLRRGTEGRRRHGALVSIADQHAASASGPDNDRAICRASGNLLTIARPGYAANGSLVQHDASTSAGGTEHVWSRGHVVCRPLQHCGGSNTHLV